MKMKFTVEQYERDCLKHEVPLNTYGAEWYKVIDGWVFEFEGDSRTAYKNGFAVSKDWCEPVEEKTACEMFEALGYEKEIRGNYVDYCKIVINEFEDVGLWRRERRIVIFDTKKKTVETYDSGVEDCIAVDGELLKAIVKQFEELGW